MVLGRVWWRFVRGAGRSWEQQYKAEVHRDYLVPTYQVRAGKEVNCFSTNLNVSVFSKQIEIEGGNCSTTVDHVGIQLVHFVVKWLSGPTG